ncbi:PA14 domain-containing protein [Nocardia goodfellowii]
MLTGDETVADRDHNLQVNLVLDFNEAPPTPPNMKLLAPADDAVVATEMPTLEITPTGTVPAGTKYCFKVSTGFDGRSGSVAQSGCLTEPKWTVPRHVLQDGTRYTWTVEAAYPGVEGVHTANWLGHFTVNERLGDPGPTPTDTLGPVTVNMFNGNARYNAAGPVFDALGGPAGVSFAYNSRAAGVAHGAKVSYFNDADHNGAADEGAAVLVRTEPQVVTNYWLDFVDPKFPLPAGLKDNWFVVRWESQFQAPKTGSYKFGGRHTDGAKMWIDDKQLYDRTESNVFPDDMFASSTATVSLTAGQRVPLKVELYHHSTAAAKMELWYEVDGGVSRPVESASLYPADPPSLPPGWTLSMPSSSYSRADVRDGSVVLTDGAGGKHTWSQNTGGGYTPPPGRDGIVAFDTAGRLSVTEGGQVTLFNVDGTVAEVSSVLDSKKPASLQYKYSGTPARLSEIHDPVSGRSHKLHYNLDGDNDCYGGIPLPKGADTPPKHQLCRITYWDGTQSLLWYYLTVLARLENPGGAITDYSYANIGEVVEALKEQCTGGHYESVWDPATNSYKQKWVPRTCTPAPTGTARQALLESIGPLSNIRGSVANDWAVYKDLNLGSNDSTAATQIGYTAFTEEAGQPQRWRATTVAGPTEDNIFGKRLVHHYGYNLAEKKTIIDNPKIGKANDYEGTLTWDETGRLLTSTDAVGDTARSEWNAKDNPTASIDTTGRRSTLIYDHADRVTDTYGPAPAACFNGQLPKPECAQSMPHARTVYDEGLVGLEAAFYDNPHLSGVPSEWRTGVGPADGSLNRNWGSAPPVANSAGWSGRFTGEIKLPEAGEYKLGFTVVDGVRLWVDEMLILDSWTDKAATAVTGTPFTNTAPGSTHRIRVDYYNRSGSSGGLDLTWTPPGAGSAVTVPGQNLRPRYGLTTGQVMQNTSGGDVERAPAKKLATDYSDPGNGIDPVLGLAVSKTGDPGGINLTGRTLVEKPGHGYLRQLAAALPAGDLADVDKRGTSVYYGDRESRSNPCVANSAAANQGGMVKAVRGPKNADGAANVIESVYDAAGRLVAARTNNEPWTCTSYDARDRIVKKSFPAMGDKPARTITYNHATDGDPLKLRISDESGSTTTTTNVAGRVTSYTDTNGNVTSVEYDDGGRIIKETTKIKGATSTLNYQWDNASRLMKLDLDGATVATPTYNAGVLQRVAYGNASNLAIGHNDAGSVDALTWKTPSSTVVSSVTRSRDQRITDAKITDTTTPGKTFDYSYSYDGVGRLVAAIVPFHKLTYDFAGDNGCGPNKKAGLNTNRTSFSDSHNGAPAVTTNYCYDDADRLLSTNGAATLSFTYDTYGNAIKVGTDTLGYDSTLRHMSTVTAAGTSINYVRDVNDRIVGRTANTDPAQATRYGFTSDAGGPDFVLDSGGSLRQRVLKLPGGALLTKTYNQTQPAVANWSYPNVHGDILFTADGTGARTGTLHLYDPFGQNIDPLTGTIGDIPIPDTAEGGLDFGWLGEHAVPIEHVASQQSLEMGARTYLPILGRFLQVDPVLGGSANAYDYCDGDPVNKVDLTGRHPAVGAGAAAIRIGWKYYQKWQKENKKPGLDENQQNKHKKGHQSHTTGKSEITTDADTLAKGAGTGKQVDPKVSRGQAGFKERVEFDKVIGKWADENGDLHDTTIGVYHYDKAGNYHVVPGKPKGS